MALVVEDGTGKTNADAYISVADTDAYNAAHGLNTAWDSAETADKEDAIKRATEIMDLRYRHRWRGARYNETQALAWPRTALVDYDGYEIAAETVPTRLTYACAYIAIRIVAGDEFFAINENVGLASRTIHNQSEGESRTWAGMALGWRAKAHPMLDALMVDFIQYGPLLERA